MCYYERVGSDSPTTSLNSSFYELHAMTNNRFNPVEWKAAARAAINARIAQKLAADPTAKVNDFEQALNRLDTYTAEEIGAGFELIAACSRLIRTPEDLKARLSIGAAKAEGFIPAKALDKAVGLAAFLGAAALNHAWDEIRARALGCGIDELPPSGKLGRTDWFADKHLTIFLGKTLPQFARRRADGKITTAVGTMREMRGFDSFRAALDNRGRGEMNLSEMNQWADTLIEAGAGDFGLTTANTQTPQIKSMLIGLGLTGIQKYDGNGFWVSGKFVETVLSALEYHGGIPDRMIESRGFRARR